MKKIRLIILTLLVLNYSLPSYSIESNTTTTTTTQNNNDVITSIPSLIFSGVGLLIGLSITSVIVLKDPKSLSINSETFVLKENNLDKKTQTFKLSNLFGLVYQFGDFVELQPSMIFSSNTPTLFSLDLGINLKNNNILEKERFGISPFFSFGVNGNVYNYINFGYGFYSKTGLTLKMDKTLVEFLLGYRAFENNTLSSNSLFLGGNVGYKF